MKARAPAQIACPFCAGPVTLRVEAVLALQAISCGSCGARLTVDRQRSGPALEQLGRWQEAVQAAQAAAPAAQWAPPEVPAAPRQRRHRLRRA